MSVVSPSELHGTIAGRLRCDGITDSRAVRPDRL